MQIKNYLIALAVTMSVFLLALAIRSPKSTLLMQPVIPEQARKSRIRVTCLIDSSKSTSFNWGLLHCSQFIEIKSFDIMLIIFDFRTLSPRIKADQSVSCSSTRKTKMPVRGTCISTPNQSDRTILPGRPSASMCVVLTSRGYPDPPFPRSRFTPLAEGGHPVVGQGPRCPPRLP